MARNTRNRSRTRRSLRRMTGTHYSAPVTPQRATSTMEVVTPEPASQPSPTDIERWEAEQQRLERQLARRPAPPAAKPAIDWTKPGLRQFRPV